MSELLEVLVRKHKVKHIKNVRIKDLEEAENEALIAKIDAASAEVQAKALRKMAKEKAKEKFSKHWQAVTDELSPEYTFAPPVEHFTEYGPAFITVVFEHQFEDQNYTVMADAELYIFEGEAIGLRKEIDCN